MKRFFPMTLAVAMLLGAAAVIAFLHNGKAQANQVKGAVDFQTGGYGVFYPANLGVGDPADSVFTGGTIVGDGSGFAAYDGPTGYEFKLDGKLVGDGWDEHFGAAQTFTTGHAGSPGVFHYPYRTTVNPWDKDGRRIHIMYSRAGQVWFEYDGFFTLDFNDLTLISTSQFRVVGGTDLFDGATGNVNVITQTNVLDIDQNGAPFRYDFVGKIKLRD